MRPLTCATMTWLWPEAGCLGGPRHVLQEPSECCQRRQRRGTGRVTWDVKPGAQTVCSLNLAVLGDLPPSLPLCLSGARPTLTPRRLLGDQAPHCSRSLVQALAMKCAAQVQHFSEAQGRLPKVSREKGRSSRSALALASECIFRPTVIPATHGSPTKQSSFTTVARWTQPVALACT